MAKYTYLHLPRKPSSAQTQLGNVEATLSKCFIQSCLTAFGHVTVRLVNDKTVQGLS